MAATLTLILALATLAFGAVYPWGYLPLFVCAGAIGLAGVVRARGIPQATRAIAAAIAVVVVAVIAQLVPLPRGVLEVVSPHAAAILSVYNLSFAHTTDPVPLSIQPQSTMVVLAGLIGFGLYLVGTPALLSSRAIRLLARNVVLFAVPLALFGMYSREHNNGLVYGFWQPVEGTNFNGFGPFVNRNHFAGWMLMASCLAIGILCGRLESALAELTRMTTVRPGWRHRVLWLAKPNANHIVLAAASIAVMAVSLVWTLSRSGILSFGLALVLFAMAIARRRHVSRAKRVAVVALLVVLLAGSVSWRGADRVVGFFGDTTDLFSRLAAWRDGWVVVRDFPIAGTGLGTYRDAMLFYQRSDLQVWMSRAHNDYLQVLAEGGVLVALPALILLVVLAWTIRRRLIDDTVATASGPEYSSHEYWIRLGAVIGLVAIGFQESVEFSLQIPANAFLFTTLAVIALCPPRLGARPDPSVSR